MADSPCMEPRFFDSPSDFRDWLEENHDAENELLVGFYKRATGKPSMTWSESVDEALCFGWIDGVRRRVDDESYSIRFTPRRPSSTWSRTNLEKVKQLKATERMQPTGLAVYEKRNRAMSQREAFDQTGAGLDEESERDFKRHKAAWRWFQELAPGYRKQSIGWVMSGKKKETRQRRLAILIESSAAGRKIPPLGG